MDYPFTTDGCSGGMTWAWRKLCGTDPPWESACVEHDRWYWSGGAAALRRQADAKLLANVARAGHPVWAILMWAAVRFGGAWFFPLPWRWGYGWKYPRYRE